MACQPLPQVTSKKKKSTNKEKKKKKHIKGRTVVL